MTPHIEEAMMIPYIRRTYELYDNTENYYKVVSGKRPLCIGGENNIFPRKLDDDFLSREMPDDMIYYNKSKSILVQEKRENYFDYSDVDVAIDFNLKGYISDVSTMKTTKQAIIAMCYKLN
ncbi:MAG: hypothetical protein K0S67_1428 [Nitrososphaeraceae archaeon]|jgi:hypothetical protein|nr:hypothetical protein [Nitrososphaeraceae archaeon]MDF2767352.1 hypothetical protein [Nitrososphaeraceae archaeon]